MSESSIASDGGLGRTEAKRNEVGSTIRALQYPRPDTSKARCGSRKAKIDSRDDDDLCSYVSCMGLATIAVETGDSGQPELFDGT